MAASGLLALDRYLALREKTGHAGRPLYTNGYLDHLDVLLSMSVDDHFQLWAQRKHFLGTYAFAILNREALEALRQHAPIVEIGAGNGYWAYEMRKAGIDVQAYDSHPPHKRRNTYYGSHSGPHQPVKVWTPVLRGRAQKAKHRPKHTLFLCWPPYNEPMANVALSSYTGSTLIYVGEGAGGCTGDDAFFEQLEQHWRCDQVIPLPQWPGIHDRMEIYHR